MLTGDICAFCRHWEIGTLDAQTRYNAVAKFDQYPCHVKQPQKTDGCDTCPNFDRVVLTTGKEMI